MKLILERFCYSDLNTQGKLWLEDDTFLWTLERPWLPGMSGGMPFESCIPDGTYKLLSHMRPSGEKVYALHNPELGVYYTDQERAGRAGRYLILIHSANWVEQVVGCIAPGMTSTIADNKRMVRSSRQAMKKVMAKDYKSIVIRPVIGAR